MNQTANHPKGYGRVRKALENRARYERALVWLAFRFDLAAADRKARERSIQDQLTATGGVDPCQFPKTSDIAYLKFADL